MAKRGLITFLVVIERTWWGAVRWRPSTWVRPLALCCLSLLGCASIPPTVPPTYQSAVSATHRTPEDALFTLATQPTTDLDRLAQLWQRRTREDVASDYPIGPGDVIEISVPAMEEITDRLVRISGDGTITLPFIGRVQAVGLTEEELREAIRRRLEEYMHAPQLNLYVREYRSRQVAVIGAVAKPGLYSLASETDTVLDMIASAGGMRPEAAPRILLIPAERVESAKAREVAAALPMQLLSKDPIPLILKRTDPIVIDLQNVERGGQQQYLPLPVRPGDVIIVPGGGDVLVQGWVEKPGAYKISPGLTLLGAVAAAGGSLYPANPSAVRLIRSGKQGEKIAYTADLERIKRGEESDITVQEGDVVDVTSSTPKLIPYGVYRFFASIFHIGAAIPFY